MSENRARLIRGITHDLKNPLGAARGHLELLRAGIVQEPARREDSLERSDRAIGTALEIIDDLLLLSRAEAGELPLRREAVDPESLVQELVEDQRPQAEQAGLSVELESGGGVPPLRSDARRFREIVRNLLSNAVKYTPEGGRVRVRVGLDPARGGGSRVSVAVTDTGPGIASDEMEGIFREFSRLPGEGSAEGSGLGLAISRQVARLMGGDIEVESEPGRGSTFVFWLPLDPDR